MTSWGHKIGRWLTEGRTQANQGQLNLSPPGTKASAVSGLLGGASKAAFIGFAAPRWTGRSYEALAREGYRKNVIVNRSVRIISESTAAVPFQIFRGDKKLDRHPALDLLKMPNPLQSGKEMLAGFYAFLEIAGNAYLELVTGADGKPGELYVLRPERMRVVPGPNGWPARYEYKVSGKTHQFIVDSKTGKGPILHLRNFNPEDDHYGLSALEPSAFAVGIHNSAADWNKALLDNAARPSGALIFEPGDGAPANLSDEQFRRLKDELENNYQGAVNAGRPFLLEGGLKWTQLGLSPHDMEFIQSKNISAREIALAFGIPPMILGIPGDNTYANYQEANRALWRLTLLPLLEKMCAGLNSWLIPRFGPDLRLDFDRDAIPALTFEREAEWNRVGNAQFLTINEKRKKLGFEPIKDGDKLASDLFAPPGGGVNFFKQGAGGQKTSDPQQEKIRKNVEIKGTGRAETAACYSRHDKIQKFYKSAAAKDPNISFEKIWRSSKDSKTRFSHRAADGQVVPLDKPFTVGGEKIFLPCDLIDGTPGNVFGCRCQVDYRKLKLDPATNTWNPESVVNGNKAILSDSELGKIVFNETASFSGSGISEARKVITHAIINADEKLGPARVKTRGTASPIITRPLSASEQKDLQRIITKIIPEVRVQRLNGIDLSDGQEPFGFRDITNLVSFPNGLEDVVSLARMNPNPEQVWKVLGPFNNNYNNPGDGLFIGTENIYFIIFEGRNS